MHGIFQSTIFQPDVFQICVWYPPLEHDLGVQLEERSQATASVEVRPDGLEAQLERRLQVAAAVEVRPNERNADLIEVREKPSGEVTVL
jgi:hypothetical protein